MSVFTPVSREQLDAFLDGFEVGRLIDVQGIEGGSENSNFFVSCTGGEFVLTLVERGDPQGLPFIVELLDCLHRAELSVPYAVTDRQGVALHQLNGKPAMLQPRLAGRHVERPDAAHCEAVGRWLAQMHAATAASSLERTSERGLAWMQDHLPRLSARQSANLESLLQALLDRIVAWRQQSPDLPRAVLHADLFRDNVMFDGHHLSGVIDFYNAASGWALYDVAIAVNDWCLDETGGLEPRLTRNLLAGYASLRRFTPAEQECWPDMLRLAALRFWLSRHIAAEQHAGQPGVLVKDPEHFLQLLRRHQQVGIGLPLAL